MRATRTNAVFVVVVVLASLAAGCGGPDPGPDEDPAPLPRTATVFETREEACRDLELRIAAGEIESSDRQLTDAESRATRAMREISDQLSAYEEVVYTGATECGESAAVSVGVSTRLANVPAEMDGVPLVVFHQPPIEPF